MLYCLTDNQYKSYPLNPLSLNIPFTRYPIHFLAYFLSHLSSCMHGHSSIPISLTRHLSHLPNLHTRHHSYSPPFIPNTSPTHFSLITLGYASSILCTWPPSCPSYLSSISPPHHSSSTINFPFTYSPSSHMHAVHAHSPHDIPYTRFLIHHTHCNNPLHSHTRSHPHTHHVHAFPSIISPLHSFQPIHPMPCMETSSLSVFLFFICIPSYPSLCNHSSHS